MVGNVGSRFWQGRRMLAKKTSAASNVFTTSETMLYSTIMNPKKAFFTHNKNNCSLHLNELFLSCHAEILLWHPLIIVLWSWVHTVCVSQLTPWAGSQVFIRFDISFRQVSFNHSPWGHTPELFPKRTLQPPNVCFRKKEWRKSNPAKKKK